MLNAIRNPRISGFAAVQDSSQHGSVSSSQHGLFTIDGDEEDDDSEEEVVLNDGQITGSTGKMRKDRRRKHVKSDYDETNETQIQTEKLTIFTAFSMTWSALTFSWVRPLLTVGNQRPLDQSDLYDLASVDSSRGVYSRFRKYWRTELKKLSPSSHGSTDNGTDIRTKIKVPSFPMALFRSFGTPYMMVGGLKLFHDSCMFVGPMMLNRLIVFLSDPTIPLSTGLYYVLGIFLSNFAMSICLRQYFWWCYRVGMRLRSAAITAVFNKSLVLSAAALSRRTTGEISNLMSVDSARLQELTPYGHAIWYSFFQIIVALYLLWRQLGPSSFAGCAMIIISGPMTSKVSQYLKTLQKQLSTVRDERVKVSNEVLAGMKVIKCQAWEEEFENRINVIRDKELALYRKYAVAQALSGAIYSALPLLTGTVTFIAYIALGNTLDVATALTSLALFEILRFPLYMLPNVINNLIEARVAVDRIQSFLLEPQRAPVPKGPLEQPGVLLDRATLVWEGSSKIASTKKDGAPSDQMKGWLGALTERWRRMHRKVQYLLARFEGVSASAAARVLQGTDNDDDDEDESDYVLLGRYHAYGASGMGGKKGGVASVVSQEEEYMNRVSREQVSVSEERIQQLEATLRSLQNPGAVDEHTGGVLEKSITLDKQYISDVGGNGGVSTDGDAGGGGASAVVNDGASPSQGASAAQAERLLTLARVTLRAGPGDLLAIVGQVGSGKSSVLAALLGEMRLCFGQVARRGRVAYVGQRPFIQNSTLRDNITFGLAYDEERYQRTLRECALVPDLKVLPAGDLTEIGERGINLSGGQKARVALARAVYADADVYLLDDPLAAVDAHVGQHLFEHVVCTLQTRGKCVVLVTNALQFLRTVTTICVLKDGQVVESGTYEELCQAGRWFRDMINAHQDTSGNNPSSSKDGENGVSKGQNGAVVGVVGNGSATVVAAASEEADLHTMIDSQQQQDREGKQPDNDTSTSTSTTTTKPLSGAPANASITPSPGASSGTSAGQLVTIEDKEVGDVSRRVYLLWLRAAGGISVGFMLLVLYYGAEAIAVLASWWLSYWSENNGTNSPWFYLGIYIVINVGVSVSSLVKELYMRVHAWDAGQLLFRELLTAVLHAPMSFFDTTPLGRITNRFSKDIYTIDESIPQTIRWYIGCVAKVTGVLLYTCFVTPLFIIGLVPICAFYWIAQRYYIKTSRELTRLESTSRSPIYALFSETLDGLPTLRAYKSEDRFRLKNDMLLDANQKAYFLNFSANCWLAVRLELVGTMIATLAALFAVLGRETTASLGGISDPLAKSRLAAYAGLAGLSISFSLSVTQSLNWSVRMASDLESQMVSVERVAAYTAMEQERPHRLPGDPNNTINSSSALGQDNDNDDLATDRTSSSSSSSSSRVPKYRWPSQGMIRFQDVCLRYRPGLPLVLAGITLEIKPREKVGIVGRTGAGKSSLVTALLRIVELESGRIFIDDVDISMVGLLALRSQVAVIPQDPVLFSGTIRSNLDPFGAHSDAHLWDNLRRTMLHTAVHSLDDVVAENGSNYSVGQRQLLCIARALLAQSKVIVMDEATAAVDVETDAAIQRTIREEFKAATCLTVAHRLNTILDSDRVLVLEQGRVAEFDTPQALLAQPNSMFAALVADWESSNQD